MLNVIVDLKTDQSLKKIRRHLFTDHEVERAIFLFARNRIVGDDLILEVIDSIFLDRQDFQIQSAYHIELKDQLRSRVIKKAHDLDASLIEIHSHIDQESARFSPTDWLGFKEFVPHVLWRLKNKPYCAVVFTQSSVDAVIWGDDFQNPCKLDKLVGGTEQLLPTNNSLENLRYGFGDL